MALMRKMRCLTLLLFAGFASSFIPSQPLAARQIPASPNNFKTIVSPSGVTIRYKEPGKEGICETTPGVKSYSGYIDLSPTSHSFFWFFESRRDPANDQITLWLNAPELGPCNVTKDNRTLLNPYGWNEVSNLLFISQPIGVGFSYAEQAPGSLQNETGEYLNASRAPVEGTYPVTGPDLVDTSDLAAASAWHVLQGFYSALPQLASTVKSKEFNLWTESYGGHYGPSFFQYFLEHNRKIANGQENGIQLNLNTLGIGNGIIDELIQVPYYPEFAVNNTYGIKGINDTVYSFAKFALNRKGGCLDQLHNCRKTNLTSPTERAICVQASNMCRDNVEGPYEALSDRGTYDIRENANNTVPPEYWKAWLNRAEVQNALGVAANYSSGSSEIYYAFQMSGDFVYPSFVKDLEMLLENGVRVALYYGDADYICNWFGGEAVSLAVNYTHAAQFRAAGYAPFVVDNTEYGAVRQYGNFSFLRIYDAGHLVPYYQPRASLEMFRRSIEGLDVATGIQMAVADFGSKGSPNSTRTEPFVPLPKETGEDGGPPAAVGGRRR
ncbi:putative carboxypeptidase S1 [Phyllosticta citribraziliensis]|uniref:Carboxypeptidase n=1 Tax=Phyllosticta citribraziliensis TaxID=989973 RepID=A0ABR1M9W5_9PEZI